jgi:uncharacterized XkdX family phage protein
MNRSPAFERLKQYYEDGLWSAEMLRNAVKKGKITPEEFELITGEKYESEATTNE